MRVLDHHPIEPGAFQKARLVGGHPRTIVTGAQEINGASLSSTPDKAGPSIADNLRRTIPLTSPLHERKITLRGGCPSQPAPIDNRV